MQGDFATQSLDGRTMTEIIKEFIFTGLLITRQIL
jgi:hypothetical protein